MSILATSDAAFSDWMDFLGGSFLMRRDGSMASMAWTEYSAEAASGTYLDPPSATSVAAKTKSLTTWKQRATDDGEAKFLVLDSDPSRSDDLAERHKSRNALVAV